MVHVQQTALSIQHNRQPCYEVYIALFFMRLEDICEENLDGECATPNVVCTGPFIKPAFDCRASKFLKFH